MIRFKTILVFIMILFAGFSGCMRNGGKIVVPVTMPQAFTDSGDNGVPEEWWTAFGDDQLNALVRSSLSGNLDIRTAWHRMRAVRAAAGIAKAPLYPEIEAEISAESVKAEEGGDEEKELGLNFNLGYEVDLWGKIRSEAAARRFEARASLTDYQTAALSVSAEVVLTWLRMIEARSQIRMLGEQAMTNDKMLTLIRARAGSGQVRGVDILRQKMLIESTLEQKIAWETRFAVLENNLKVLTGGASTVTRPEEGARLPDIPPLPDTGLPAELVQRRPDVKSAYYRVHAADRELSAALRSLYPRLSLSAGLRSTDHDSVSLIRDWARSLAANLLAPVFRGGELRARVRRTREVREQILMEYGGVVLNAIREVEDALVQESQQSRRIVNLDNQLELVRVTHKQLRAEYFNGLSDYLDVLTVVREEQQLAREVLSAHLQRLEYRVKLYRALAGGIRSGLEKKHE